MFILVIDGLSKLIGKAKEDKFIKGIKIPRSMFITHLLFVDDVLFSRYEGCI